MFSSSTEQAREWAVLPACGESSWRLFGRQDKLIKLACILQLPIESHLIWRVKYIDRRWDI